LWLITLASLTLVVSAIGLAPDFATAGELPDPTAVSHAGELMPVTLVPMRTAPPVDLVAVAAEDRLRDNEGLPPRFAIPFEVSITPDLDGVWENLDDGTLVWRLRVSSQDAGSLNLGFGRYEMPDGGRLHIYAPDYIQAIRPFTAADNADHRQLWTPVLRTDTVVVEVTLPADARDELLLELTSINVGYRGFGLEDGPDVDSGSCNIDVICPEGDDWRDEIPSVAALQRSGSLLCTGFMVNNAAQNEKPLFMTARHCGVTSSTAATVVAYWNYETSVCGGTPDGSLAQFTTGSTWRSSYSPSDFTLVELSSVPDPGWGVTFSGWDATGSDASSAVAIHHPSVDEKRISFENDATTTTSYLGSSVPGDGTHVRVIDWDAGTTEGGSSGSPLYDQNHRVIGQLHGGYAACGNDSSDWYGKLSVSWTGGGTSSTRLKDWLDPGNTGTLTLDTLVPGAGCGTSEDCDDGLFCNGEESCQAGSCVAGSDPCPGEGCDEVADVCVPPICDNDGTCETGEDCDSCPSDCISGIADGGTCGDSICEAGAGEDCLSCPSDCNGIQKGNPNGRYCCGDGDGSNPVSCADSRCSTGGNTCITGGTGTPYCCGDGSCGGDENGFNCEIDCGPATSCGDAVCDGVNGEDPCTCPADCGAPPSSEVPGQTCNDGVDNDCDGDVDGADADCPACVALGDPCVDDAECCSNKCRGPSGRKECK
jgi:hypothetical protein